jgi:hypothetical protein
MTHDEVFVTKFIVGVIVCLIVDMIISMPLLLRNHYDPPIADNGSF